MQRTVVVLALSLMIVACSRTQFAYDNADWLLERYAAKTIDINAVQRTQWRPVLAQVLEQHRRAELPYLIAYIDLADRIVMQVDEATEVSCLLDGGLAIARRHAYLAVDLSAPLLADLDAAQISHLREYTRERQQALTERYLDPDLEARHTKRFTRFTERVESWIGELSEDQRQLTQASVERIPDLTPAWLAYREQQTQRLLTLLESGADSASLQLHLSDWWVKWEGRSANYLRQWQIARHEFTAFLGRLAPTLTDQQRDKLRKRLGKLRRELAALLPADHSPVELHAADSICPYAPA